MRKRSILGDGKKVPLNMRTTAELRKKIDKAAGKSGRSLVQEVEYRVEMSFQRERYDFLAGVIEEHARRMNGLETLQYRIEGQLLKHEALWGDILQAQEHLGKIIAHAVNVRNGTVGTPEELEWVHG